MTQVLQRLDAIYAIAALARLMSRFDVNFTHSRLVAQSTSSLA